MLTLPRIVDSLAARMKIAQIEPLAKTKIEGRVPTFLQRLVGENSARLVPLGSLPELISRQGVRRRQNGSQSYLLSMLTEDLKHTVIAEKYAMTLIVSERSFTA